VPGGAGGPASDGAARLALESEMQITVNGRVHEVSADPDKPLLWVLREDLGLMGTKFGCGVGACGACTVHVGGEAMRGCQIPIGAVADQPITTIEGLKRDGALSAVQAAWLDAQVPQCGYCQSGMIMAVEALLNATANPTDAEIDAAITNICRCGTYDRVRIAIHAAAAARRGA
jgi:isoquinoline 1-oxidoreductase alpha subunit